MPRLQGWQAPLKAGLTSGSLSALGDLLAQGLAAHFAGQESKAAPKYDPLRTLRMLGYGCAWYGPCQYYWYNLLDWTMPVKTTATFLAKASRPRRALCLPPACLRRTPPHCVVCAVHAHATCSAALARRPCKHCLQ